MQTETILNILKLILAGSPLSEVLTIIARLVESRGDGTLCTIWLPNEDGTQLYAPRPPAFLDSSHMWERCLSVQRVDPAALRPIAESLYM